VLSSGYQKNITISIVKIGSLFINQQVFGFVYQGVSFMDKRKQKSQKIIMSAFMDLLKEKEFEKISMNDIAEKANVNRGTIYLNFMDKYDLLDKCIESNFSELVDECRNTVEEKKSLTKESLLFTFEYLEKHYDFLSALFQSVGISVFRKCMYEEIAKGLHRYDQSENKSNGIRSEVSVQFLTSAITGVLEWWFSNAMPCSSGEITDELWLLLQNNRVI
jgi:AcrR family transcriptional regulator